MRIRLLWLNRVCIRIFLVPSSAKGIEYTITNVPKTPVMASPLSNYARAKPKSAILTFTLVTSYWVSSKRLKLKKTFYFRLLRSL